MECKSCKFIIDINEYTDNTLTFCPDCGAVVRKHCEHCGVSLQDGDNYCFACGDRVLSDREKLDN